MTPRERVRALDTRAHRLWVRELPLRPHVQGLPAARLVMRIRDCGEFKRDATLCFIETLAGAAKGNKYLEALWTSVAPDGTVWLSHQDQVEVWRSVVTTVEFQVAPTPTHLDMIVSVYVPFGAEGDNSHYPVDVSNAYVRPTQALSLTAKLTASQSRKDVILSERVDEHGQGETRTDEMSGRTSRVHTQGTTSRASESSAEIRDYKPSFLGGILGIPEYSESEKRKTTSLDKAQEQRSEYQNVSAEDHQRSLRRQSDSNQRERASNSSDDASELRTEVSPLAIGIDYTDLSKLFGPWRANANNGFSSTLVDVLLHGLPGFAESVPGQLSIKRQQGKLPEVRPAVITDDVAFWEEASKWALVESSGLIPARIRMQIDGRARAIDCQVVGELVAEAQRQAASLGGAYMHGLPASRGAPRLPST